MTVGSGFTSESTPDLLTLQNRSSAGARGLLLSLATTAGEEFHLALRTLPKAMLEHLNRNENRWQVSVAKALFPFKQGLQIWLCQSVGAAAPSGGRELRDANDRGGQLNLP